MDIRPFHIHPFSFQLTSLRIFQLNSGITETISNHSTTNVFFFLRRPQVNLFKKSHGQFPIFTCYHYYQHPSLRSLSASGTSSWSHCIHLEAQGVWTVTRDQNTWQRRGVSVGKRVYERDIRDFLSRTGTTAKKINPSRMI